MQPTNVILDRIQVLLADDATTLAPAALALHVHLAAAPFTPSPTLTVASFTEATFDGSAPLNAIVGNNDAFYDGVTGLRVVQLNEPGGGWHWQVTGATELGETVYGYYVTDNTDAVLYGSALLPSPIAMNVIGKGLDIANIRLTFSAGSPT